MIKTTQSVKCSECKFSEIESFDLVCTEFGEVIEDNEPCCTAFQPKESEEEND